MWLNDLRRRFFILTIFLLSFLGMSYQAIAQNKPPLRVGFSMALTGPLAANGKAALLSMEIWREETNKNGGLIGRQVEFVYYDDQSNPSLIPGLYTKLLDSDKVEVVVSPYGTNLISPAMPLIMQRNLVFLTLFGVDVNAKFNYPGYFQMMPNGKNPTVGISGGFFDAAMTAKEKPKTVAFIGGDAEFQAVTIEGAREVAKKYNLKVVYDKSYPPNTTDFTPVLRAIQATNPDIIYVASYPGETPGLVRAANEIGLKASVFGGTMIGCGFASHKKQLGPLLNGLLCYELYVPEKTVKFEGIEAFLKTYQSRAEKEGVDPLGFYLPPYAYAQMQILGQSIEKVGSIDNKKLIDYIHNTKFTTVVGDVKFATNGEWEVGRPLYVQYRGIKGNDLEQFRKPGPAAIISPAELKSGDLITPYQEAKKR
jgi:branched-chain amino acid transport system substrate-binding protein